jgi:hypothetical protein
LRLLDSKVVFDDPPEERRKLAFTQTVFLREAEKSFQLNSGLVMTKLQQEILTLQKVAFYSRYGDYFAEVCRHTENTAQICKVVGWEKFSGEYWIDIPNRCRKKGRITRII